MNCFSVIAFYLWCLWSNNNSPWLVNVALSVQGLSWIHFCPLVKCLNQREQSLKPDLILLWASLHFLTSLSQKVSLVSQIESDFWNKNYHVLNFSSETFFACLIYKIAGLMYLLGLSFMTIKPLAGLRYGVFSCWLCSHIKGCLWMEHSNIGGLQLMTIFIIILHQVFHSWLVNCLV